MTKPTRSDELAAAQKRIAQLEARQAAYESAEKGACRAVSHSETASAAQDMPTFYAQIHRSSAARCAAGQLLHRAYDEERQPINFPFYRDEVDTDSSPDPDVWDPLAWAMLAGRPLNVLRHGRPGTLD